MGNLSAFLAGELVRVFDFSAVRKVVDVGGAHGVLLASILRANPRHTPLMAFPNGPYDDQVDSLAQALAWFTKPKRPQLMFGYRRSGSY